MENDRCSYLSVYPLIGRIRQVDNRDGVMRSGQTLAIPCIKLWDGVFLLKRNDVKNDRMDSS